MIPSVINADRRALADLFEACSIGEIVTYEQMSEAIGSDIKPRRYLIPSALKLVLNETGAAFAVVNRAGYKRLRSEEAPVVGHACRRRIRRVARRSVNTMSKMLAVGNDMPNAARVAAYKEISVAGLIEEMARDRSVRKLPDMDKPQPTAKVMRAMLGE